MAVRVGIEKVVGAGVILIHAALDEAHPEDAGVEIEVLLRRTGDGRDMMKSSNGLHRASGIIAPRATKRYGKCVRPALKKRRFESAGYLAAAGQTAAP
jgi:hypothetical protein